MDRRRDQTHVVCIDGPLFGNAIQVPPSKIAVLLKTRDNLLRANMDTLEPIYRYRLALAVSNQSAPYVPARLRRDPRYAGYYVRMMNRDGLEGAWFHKDPEPRGNPVTESGLFGDLIPPADWEPEDPADFWKK